jgi:hypothetical protein
MADALLVGTDQNYHTIADAVAASHGGDTIFVEAGTYTNDSAAIDHDLTLVGVGGYAHIDSTGSIPNGKADFVTNANVTIQNFEFSGASVDDNNGAGIRHESGALTVQNSYFHDNQEGILAGDNPASSMVIQNSTFEHNGAGDGQTHGVYVGQIASLTVDGSTFDDQVMGNQLKSRAAETTVSNSHFATGADGANYDIDLPNGGNAYIHDNTFDKGDTTSNPAIIHFGGEIDNATGSLLVEHNNFTSDLDNATAVLNQTDVPVQVVDNGFTGIANVLLGSGSQSDNLVGGLLDLSLPVDTGPATVDASAPSDSGTTDPATSDPTTADPTLVDTTPVDTTPVDTSTTDPSTADPTTSSDPVTVVGTAEHHHHHHHHWYA